MRSDGMLFRLCSLSNTKLGSGYKLRYNNMQSESIFWVWLPVSDHFTVSFRFVSCFTIAPNRVRESELTNGRELRAL